jgi:hypothetical protein
MKLNRRISDRLKILFSFVGILCLSACTLFQEKIESRQAREMPQKMSPTNLSPSASKIGLKKMEGRLSSQREIDQYSKALPWFESDDEKSEFLKLSDYESKQMWLNQKNFPQRALKTQSDMEELVQAKDIAVGMPAPLVKRSWGEPDSIEVSGNPQFKNERWKYNQFLSTSDGYKAERKIVYFEGGKVVGWEIE